MCSSCVYNAALLLKDTYETNGICPEQLTIHSDNGSPMKGQTMQAMLVALGVANSHSRPRVSNDNALSESLFKTLKLRPQLPLKPFETVQEAREWVYSFMQWYHHEHRHSGINFVTPGERRAGKDAELLRKRDEVLTEYFCKHPERFAKGKIRSFSGITQVTLNPYSKLDNTKIIA